MLNADPRILVMTQGQNKCIYAFPQERWDYYMKQIRDLDIPDRELLKLTRAVTAPAVACAVDSQWRVKLPTALIEFAELDKDVEIVGHIDKIEIWNPDTRREYMSKLDINYDDITLPLFQGKMRHKEPHDQPTNDDKD